MSNDNKITRADVSIKERLSNAFADLQASVQMAEREPENPEHTENMHKAMDDFRDALDQVDEYDRDSVNELRGRCSHLLAANDRLRDSIRKKDSRIAELESAKQLSGEVKTRYNGQTITIATEPGTMLKLAGITVTPGSGEECMRVQIGKRFMMTLSDPEAIEFALALICAARTRKEPK